jgi:hypothetical protein
MAPIDSYLLFIFFLVGKNHNKLQTLILNLEGLNISRSILLKFKKTALTIFFLK